MFLHQTLEPKTDLKVVQSGSPTAAPQRESSLIMESAELPPEESLWTGKREKHPLNSH